MVKTSTKKSLRVAVFFKWPYYVDVLIFFLKFSYCLLLLFCFSLISTHSPNLITYKDLPIFPASSGPLFLQVFIFSAVLPGTFPVPLPLAPPSFPPTDYPVPESFFLKHKCDHMTVVQPMLTCRVTWKLHPYL